MDSLREEHRAGLDYLSSVTTLLQRVRRAHPTAGLYQTAEIQFWWTIPRSTDRLPQLFWFDEYGRPEAAVTITDFGPGLGSALYDEPTLVVIVMPDTTPEWLAHVVERGLCHASNLGITSLSLEVDRGDHVMRDVLCGHGFTRKEEGLIQCWLDAADRPQISPLHDEYRLSSRLETMRHPHHMTLPPRPPGPEFERRLRETSLYRPDLDLVVFDPDDSPAGYGLFWYDPVTATGVVEPMRTHDAHQRRGLARHILTSGVNLLATAGAERISICFEPANAASGPLYLGVGFVPQQQTEVFAR